MELKVKFKETNQCMQLSIVSDGRAFDANLGEATVLHDGQNGATFIPDVSDDGVLSWTNDRGLENPDPVNIKGGDGKDGKDGINGKDGADGKDGTNGADGKTPYIQNGYWYIDGVNTGVRAEGKDGKDGADGANGINGKDGSDGVDGKDGKDGTDGYTPIKGKDYFTDADKAELVASVIAKLPVYNGEAVAV